MTMGSPDPDPAVLAALDQQVIEAGRAFAAALRALPGDPTAVQPARQALEDARAARGYADA
jgi:hypothetical protein